MTVLVAVLMVVQMMVLGVTAVAAAPPLRTVVVPPEGTVPAGQKTLLSVVQLNQGSETAEVAIPPSLTCRLTAADGVEQVIAAHLEEAAAATTVAVTSGGFVEHRYLLLIPDTVTGPALLTVDEIRAAAVVLMIVDGATTPATFGEGVTSFNPPVELRSFDELFSLYQPYLANLAAYNPMYMLAGTELEKSKLQLSFRYRFFTPDGPFLKQHSWTHGLSFAYTQTSFWDLKSSSKPFEDTSYKPELFYLSRNIEARPSWATGLFVQTGYQHESNGRGRLASRSTDYYYVKPMLILYDPGTRYGLEIAPKVWTYLNTSEENADLADYRGYFELELKAGRADSFVIGSNLRWAKKGLSVELNFTYPLHTLPYQNTRLYLHIQYANALAESMLRYQERTEALRIGFSVVR